ncbi:MAG TPA: hypothetical protein QF870_06530, partial [Nitrospinota bacterium]|nr:hypothetical protein [Nitrospinota bacterium]
NPAQILLPTVQFILILSLIAVRLAARRDRLNGVVVASMLDEAPVASDLIWPAPNHLPQKETAPWPCGSPDTSVERF